MEEKKEENSKKHNRGMAKFRIGLYSGLANGLNVLFNTDRDYPEILHQKDISYGEDKFCTYDIYSKPDVIEQMPVIFYIHGGGFVAGDKKYYHHICKDLAMKDYIVININYPLAPNVSIKEQVAKCNDAISHACKRIGKIDLSNCYLCGDSAGAALLGMVLISWTNKSLKKPAKLKIKATGLLYGLFDGSKLKGLLKRYLDAPYEYNGTGSVEDFYEEFAVLKNVTKGFPPSIIFSSEGDFIGEQSLAMIDKLKELNIPHEYIIFKKGITTYHGYMNIKDTVPYKKTIDALIKFFEKHKKTPKE